MNCIANNFPKENDDDRALKIDGVVQSDFQVDKTLRRTITYYLEIKGNYGHADSLLALVEKLESEIKLIREFAEKLSQ